MSQTEEERLREIWVDQIHGGNYWGPPVTQWQIERDVREFHQRKRLEQENARLRLKLKELGHAT